jgi:diacylglycerol kinase family enzyme
MRVAPSSLLTTQDPGHARELAATAAAQGIDTVIVLGGDFSKSLGIPRHLQEACRVIVKGRTDGWERTAKADGRGFHGVYAVLLVGNAWNSAGSVPVESLRVERLNRS